MISIVICTYNREKLLPYCLSSLANQTASQDLFEVIVVDNNSSDKTKDVVLLFLDKIRNLRYVLEDRIGLSHARNRGSFESRFDWVSFLDDDAKAFSDYVERTLWVINNYGFDCFGGRFFPWYLSPRPKWLPEDFGLFPKLLETTGELPSNMHAAGGVIVFRKSALNAVGGFPPNLGMSGSEVGYGEENWVQDEMRARNCKIGFDPELKIDHLVASYKYRLNWHFKRAFAKGKTERIFGKGAQKNPVYLIIWALLVTLKGSIINAIKLFTRRNYYFQNYLLDTFGFFVKTWSLVKS